MSSMPIHLDLPLITEATNEYYRSIYADPDLAPVFAGVNMIVLRTHVSYFIHQLTMFDTPMTERQLEYLKKVHMPVILNKGVTQKHYDLMIGYLLEAMRTNEAPEDHLMLVKAKLQPLRDLFPPNTGSVDGHMMLQEQGQSVDGSQQEQDKGSKAASSKKKVKAWLKRLVTSFNKQHL